MERKAVSAILFVSLLSMALTLPMIPLASSSVTTLTINAPQLPTGHATHTPLLDGGFWLNTGTLGTPVWTYRPWGSTVPPTLSNSPTKDPTTTSGKWTSGTQAYTSDDKYASGTRGSQIYGGYGVSGIIYPLVKVEVGLERKTLSGGDDSVTIAVSDNGGASWSATTITVVVTELTDKFDWYDFTSAYTWTPSGVASISVKITYGKVGRVATNIYVDWIPVRVTEEVFDVKVPAQIRDSWAHSFQITSWPGVTVSYGPEAETAHGDILVPTYRWRLGPGTTTPTLTLKRAGPEIDVLRGMVITGPTAQLLAMQTGAADVWSSSSGSMGLFWHQMAETGNLMGTSDIETLAGAGFTVTYDAAFQMGHIGFNIRPLATQHHADGSPRRPDTTIWPLADVAFRHALFHTYNQETIVASIYGYTATPVQSLVPPAQGGWVNPSVPKHPYNPGKLFPIAERSPPGEHSSVGILLAAGYAFVDADGSSSVTSGDYWIIGGVRMPRMTLWTPTLADAPASFNHGAMFVADLGKIGLAATTANGNSGFTQVQAAFADYMDQVDAAEFDAYMSFWDLHRFPDHLYDMCHSSQICGPEPENKGKYNMPGINDPDIDAATLTIKTSLNHDAKLQAAYEAQELLCDETRPNAMAYMQLCSKIHFNAFNPDLRGIVDAPGFGSDNYWTYMNVHWAPGSAGEAAHTNPDGTKFIDWIWGEAPERLNPCYASTVYAWDLMGKTMDGLLDVNPYTHQDLPAMSSQLPTIVEVGDHMEITFYIRKDVFWQDGNPYRAQDAKFNWDFLKNNAIPRYTTMWQYIDHVEVIDDYTVKVTTNAKSQFLVYDFAGTAALLPPNVWAPLDGTGLPNIFAYDPSADKNPTGMGPWFGTMYGPNTRLFGTGPYVFDYWDPVGQVWEAHQFAGYYRFTEDVHTQKVEMFHAVGDVDRDGTVWADDTGAIAALYGTWWWEPEYDPDVDVNSDGVIDIMDASLANYHFGQQREYPVP